MREVEYLTATMSPRKFLSLAMMLLILFSQAPTAYAAPLPPIPHSFYGGLTINGQDAPVGTQVSARVKGVTSGSYATTAVGRYGDRPRANYLVVTGNILPGDTINFYVNGVDTAQTATFEPGGGPTELNLAIGPARASSTTTPGTSSQAPATSQDSPQMVTTQPVVVTSEDSICRLSIGRNVVALDSKGNPLSQVIITRLSRSPVPPGDASLIGLTYDFGPEGATFDPPVRLELGYDPSNIPAGVSKGDLFIAYYDKSTARWVKVETTTNTGANTVTAFISHFTAFAILSPKAVLPSAAVPSPAPVAPAKFTLSSLTISPTEASPAETVTVSVLVANTGGQPANYKVTLKIGSEVEAITEITVNAGASRPVSFTTTRNAAGTYSVEVNGLTGSFMVKKVSVGAAVPAPASISPTLPPVPPASPAPVAATPAKAMTNWPVLGGAIAVTAVVTWLTCSLIRRRRY